MSRASTTLRPFSTPISFDEALSLARFHMGESICERERSVTIDSADEYLRCKPALSWARNEAQMDYVKALLRQGIEEAQVDADDLGVVVVAYARYLQIADVVYTLPLSELDGLERLDLSGTQRPDALKASTHGATVTAYIALLREQPQQSLMPWRKGTWLARARFRLELPDAVAALFHPTPLTREVREQLPLGQQTSRHFALEDHDPLAPFDQGDRPTFYVDEEVLTQIHAARSQALAKALQMQLACDFIHSAVTAAAAKHRSASAVPWEEAKDSLIGRIVRYTAGPNSTADHHERWLKVAMDEPAIFIAHAEHRMGIRRALLNSFEEPA